MPRIPDFKFLPLSHSWVAVHPCPIGVVQFIGGAFFGTFPTLFYRYFLRKLFEAGYTVVALPYRFSFRHWPIAIGLLLEQQILRQALADIAGRIGYDPSVYADKSKYFWIGHSLGCKYIVLLEVLSNEGWPADLAACATETTSAEFADILIARGGERPSILDQPSLLIAPNNADLDGAVPIPILAQACARIGLKVLPTRQETRCFVERSRQFNLSALISFKDDTIAGSETKDEHLDAPWFLAQLLRRRQDALHTLLPGKHLEPLGWQWGDRVFDLNPFDKFSEPLADRQLEQTVLRMLAQLAARSGASNAGLGVERCIINV